MRIDQEYLKNILDRILEHKSADFDLNLFLELWNNEEDVDAQHKFVFHLELLEDQGFIASSTSINGIGIRRSSNKADPYNLALTPLRLTSSGHDFAAALNKPDVFKILKEKFNNDGPFEFVKAAIMLSTKAAEKKLTDLLND
ncbi:DUF2513 domain-containing protein [Aliikangiella coralliicola]|uniref:DUF2513 domain-containing protein n=1 Tax=Aliikangiella coralliicola TaxID=2592383 RepID=A0A545U8Z2_9GAMM|nr:DUF2513 domain-containing protein [Aliikangiella coralliicola]TQV85936.1 DUF2513 domain-containing protein [Aliikangiella coralliicola]